MCQQALLHPFACSGPYTLVYYAGWSARSVVYRAPCTYFGRGTAQRAGIRYEVRVQTRCGRAGGIMPRCLALMDRPVSRRTVARRVIEYLAVHLDSNEDRLATIMPGTNRYSDSYTHRCRVQLKIIKSISASPTLQ